MVVITNLSLLLILISTSIISLDLNSNFIRGIDIEIYAYDSNIIKNNDIKDITISLFATLECSNEYIARTPLDSITDYAIL